MHRGQGPHRLPGIWQRSPGAPHPPQCGRGRDAARRLPVKLEEWRHEVFAVRQGQVPQLGVRAREVDVHDDRTAGLTLPVLHGGRRLRLSLSVGHAGRAHLVLSPLDVAPVQLPLHILLLQEDVLQRRHYERRGIVVQHQEGGGEGGGVGGLENV